MTKWVKLLSSDGWMQFFFDKKKPGRFRKMTLPTVVPEDNIPITLCTPSGKSQTLEFPQTAGGSYLRTSMKKTLASMVGLEGLVVEVSHQH